MKYIVYRGLRRKDLGDFDYEEGEMELSLTILSRDSYYKGMYRTPISQKKKPTLKQVEELWEDKVAGIMFEHTMGNSLNNFHTSLFLTSKNWNERDECIRRFEALNTKERILPGHYEF